MSIDTVSATIAAVMWMALAVSGFVTLRKWNRRFQELYEKFSREMEEQT